METKLLWLSDTKPHQFGAPSEADTEIIFSNMVNFARSVARPTTEITVEFVSENIGEHFAPFMHYPRAFMAVEILERLRQAEVDGYDAAFPGMCFGEFFLQGARQAVTMPVVGAAESSMLIAQMLGKKFGVLTVASVFENIIEENIRLHRWEGAAISHRPVRSWPMTEMAEMMLEAYAGRPDRLIDEFDKRAQELVRDGADVVICGCNPYGAALAQVGYNKVSGTGVPVVTALAAQIKLAETLVDLRRSVGLSKSESVNGPYSSTSPEVLADMAAHSIGMPQIRQSRARATAPKLYAA